LAIFCTWKLTGMGTGAWGRYRDRGMGPVWGPEHGAGMGTGAWGRYGDRSMGLVWEQGIVRSSSIIAIRHPLAAVSLCAVVVVVIVTVAPKGRPD